jgi:hypothetical protein
VSAPPELNGRRPVDRDFDNVANNVSLSLLLSEALLLLSEEELLDEVAVRPLNGRLDAAAWRTRALNGEG